MENDLSKIELNPLDFIFRSPYLSLWPESSDMLQSDGDLQSSNRTNGLQFGATEFDELINKDILQLSSDIQQVTLSNEELEQRESETKTAIYLNLDEFKTVTPFHEIDEPQMLPPFTEVFPNESVDWNVFSEDAIDFAYENNNSNYEANEIKNCSSSIISEDIIQLPSQSSIGNNEPSTDFELSFPKVRRRGRPAKPVRIKRNELELAKLSEEERKLKEMRLRNNESCRKTRRKIQQETQKMLKECVSLESTNKKLKKVYLKKKSLNKIIVDELKALL